MAIPQKNILPVGTPHKPVLWSARNNNPPHLPPTPLCLTPKHPTWEFKPPQTTPGVTPQHYNFLMHKSHWYISVGVICISIRQVLMKCHKYLFGPHSVLYRYPNTLLCIVNIRFNSVSITRHFLIQCIFTDIHDDDVVVDTGHQYVRFVQIIRWWNSNLVHWPLRT